MIRELPKPITWPAWYYSENGDSAVFNSASEVPKGWRDSPIAFGIEDFEDPLQGIFLDPIPLVNEFIARGIEYDARWPAVVLKEKLDAIIAAGDTSLPT